MTAQAETQITKRSVAEEGGELGAVENEDAVTSIVEFASGLLGTLETTRVRRPPRRDELRGARDKGAMRWDFQRLNEFEV